MRERNYSWKKSWAAAGLALVLFTGFVTGCSKNKLADATAESITEAATGEAAQLPNPMQEVDGPGEFETIGVHMVAPAGAKDLKCFIINGEVADMQFTMDGVSYTWRASDTAEDFAGIFERFEEEILTEEYVDGSLSAQIEIRTTESGGRLASWAWGSARYTLYTPNGIADTVIKDMALTLAQLSENER